MEIFKCLLCLQFVLLCFLQKKLKYVNPAPVSQSVIAAYGANVVGFDQCSFN